MERGSVASFGSGNTTDSEHQQQQHHHHRTTGEKVLFFVTIIDSLSKGSLHLSQHSWQTLEISF
jgi:hypothetical protein